MAAMLFGVDVRDLEARFLAGVIALSCAIDVECALFPSFVCLFEFSFAACMVHCIILCAVSRRRVALEVYSFCKIVLLSIVPDAHPLAKQLLLS